MLDSLLFFFFPIIKVWGRSFYKNVSVHLRTETHLSLNSCTYFHRFKEYEHFIASDKHHFIIYPKGNDIYQQVRMSIFTTVFAIFVVAKCHPFM